MKRKFLISEFKWIFIGIALIGFLVFLHITRPPHREIFIVTGGVLILVAFIIVFEYMLYGRANLFPMSFLQKINDLTKTNHELFIHFGSKRIRIELDKVFSAIPAGLDKANSFTYGYQCYFDNEDRYDKKTDSDEAKKNDFESDDDIVIRNMKHDYLVNIDVEGKIIYVSDTTLALFPKTKDAFLNKNITSLHDVFGIDSDQWFEDIKARYRSQSTAEIDGVEGKKWLYWNFEAVTDVFGKVVMIIATGHEITNLINLRQQSHPNHTFDYQTNLINQQGLYEKIAEIKNAEKAICFFIDIWNFSNVTDYYGHRISDEIIVMIADQLKHFEGPNCIVSRFSSSKFVVLVLGRTATKEVLDVRIEHVNDYLTSTYQLEENVIQIEKRIGYAVYPEDTDNLEKLISLASLAMKESKPENQFALIKYKKTIGEILKKNIAISVKLKHALDSGLVEVYFQKAIDAFTGDVVYLEELARWRDHTLGYIPPIEMFSAAKEANLVEHLDKYLVEEAIRQFAFLRNSGKYPYAKLAINITPTSLMDPRFATFFIDLATKYSVKTKDICIEISESTFVNSLEACIDRINDFKAYGFQIALDDFGKDYSSLAILESVPFDIIKIDKLFIDKLQDDKNREIIKMIRNITNLYHKEIIAEGVETEAQRQCLLELGCVIQQGYLHHKPEKMT